MWLIIGVFSATPTSRAVTSFWASPSLKKKKQSELFFLLLKVKFIGQKRADSRNFDKSKRIKDTQYNWTEKYRAMRWRRETWFEMFLKANNPTCLQCYLVVTDWTDGATVIKTRRYYSIWTWGSEGGPSKRNQTKLHSNIISASLLLCVAVLRWHSLRHWLVYKIQT